MITLKDAKDNLGSYAYLISPRGTYRDACKIIGSDRYRVLVKFVSDDTVNTVHPSRLIIVEDKQPIEHVARRLVKRFIELMHHHHWTHAGEVDGKL